MCGPCAASHFPCQHLPGCEYAFALVFFQLGIWNVNATIVILAHTPKTYLRTHGIPKREQKKRGKKPEVQSFGLVNTIGKKWEYRERAENNLTTRSKIFELYSVSVSLPAAQCANV